MPDKYTATWVSHSSIGDFLDCPRAYYLKNVYKDPNTGHKITIMTPSLALGHAVHSILESLSVLPANQRITMDLLPKFRREWYKVSGKKGGFLDINHEHRYKKRGEEMIERVYNNPGPLINLAVKMKQDLLQYWISREEEIILCGKIDWMEYFKEEDTVHIIDFKTGQNRSNNSLQLPIYYLLAVNCQNRTVAKASYWYLALDDNLTEVELPNLELAHKKVLDVGRQIKLARQLKKFSCPHNGCRACEPFEKIIKGEGEFIGVGSFNRDIYSLPTQDMGEDMGEVIL
ncbi:MAG: PD-(D/E)XK nuclease family protein [Patescibacteria group bacterium]|jgi:ATP-dependent helicase/DNAse subunit B